MIEIRHVETGAVLHRFEVETLARADLTHTNLCWADLTGMDLSGVVLAGSVCRSARFRGADLSHADLRGAYLAQAEFQGANLNGALLFSNSLDTADLTDANLSGANLTGAYLAEAKLVRANLCYASFQSAYLGGADLTGAQLAFTLFTDCHSLVQAVGLDQVEHLGPSMFDPGTLHAGASTLPELFLRGVGLTGPEIESLRAVSGAGARFASCFLAADAADGEFAALLRANLLARDVSCWPFRGDLQAGYVLQIVFNHAIRRRSRFVMVCSEASVQHGGVLEAAQNVMGHKPEHDPWHPVLILLDDALHEGASDGAGAWHRYLKVCPVVDFRGWRDEAVYRARLQTLLEALRR